ncbi:MAG TPA: FAD-dependent oxidoreductase [Puia sp.]|jgi:CDP-4-dehydro-6-deoxyglucose reductase|nr:FAD-dependent oxidoreductase [Puia sp.]
MLQPWQTGKIIRIENATEQTRRFWIQLPGLESFDFQPGQFVTLDLPIHEKLNKRVRSYSISSWPDGTNVLELVIVLLEGGAGTHYLFNECTVGSELTLRGPQGVFTLPEPIGKDLFFICTGTGIAPFRSMAHYLLNHQIPYKDIYLIFGCRHFSDCLYEKELRELEQQMPGFHYIPTFSREKTDDPKIRTGYVHAVYEEICRTHQAASPSGELRPASFFLCGWKNMIDEAKQRIQMLGYDRKSIHQELYG